MLWAHRQEFPEELGQGLATLTSPGPQLSTTAGWKFCSQKLSASQSNTTKGAQDSNAGFPGPFSPPPRGLYTQKGAFWSRVRASWAQVLALSLLAGWPWTKHFTSISSSVKGGGDTTHLAGLRCLTQNVSSSCYSYWTELDNTSRESDHRRAAGIHLLRPPSLASWRSWRQNSCQASGCSSWTSGLRHGGRGQPCLDQHEDWQQLETIAQAWGWPLSRCSVLWDVLRFSTYGAKKVGSYLEHPGLVEGRCHLGSPLSSTSQLWHLISCMALK